MEAMFESVADEFRCGSPIGAWRKTYLMPESALAQAMAEAGERWPGVLIGSYPAFLPEGPQVEVVVKSSDPGELEDASAWLDEAIQRSANKAADGR